jgi:hypothetical protein
MEGVMKLSNLKITVLYCLFMASICFWGCKSVFGAAVSDSNLLQPVSKGYITSVKMNKTVAGVYNNMGATAYDIAVDENRNTYFTGESNGLWGNPISPFIATGSEIFVAKLDSDENLVWNTFLGSSDDDSGKKIVLDEDGYIYVTGCSKATWGTPINAHSAAGANSDELKSDAFVAKLDLTETLYGIHSLDHPTSTWVMESPWMQTAMFM